MLRNRYRFFLTLVWLLFAHLFVTNSLAITRDAVISTADSYANYGWHCSASNADNTYNYFIAGESYIGVAYNWGGVDTLAQFQSKIDSGSIAGDSKIFGVVHSDFSGVDCSGFVSRAWATEIETGVTKYNTTGLSYISIEVPWNNLQPGDITNWAGTHVRLFHYFTEGTNLMMVSEATVPPSSGNTARVVYSTLDRDNNYIPRRFYSFVNIGEKIETTAELNVRNTPGGTSLGTVPAGTTGTIMDGPELAFAPYDYEPYFKYAWWYIQYDNGVEGWSAITYLRITSESDTTPPTGSISINSNAIYSKSTSVTLTISATDDSSGVSQMCISNTASCSSWESYATSKVWTLPSGDGTKTVYIWFKDTVGNANTSPYSDSIVLDTTAPTDGTLSASAGNGQVLLSWNGSDTTSGINSYKLVYSTSSTPSSCSGGTQIYSGSGTSYTHSSLTNGTTYYYRVCATDNAGNVSIGATAQSTPLGTEQYQLITSVNPVGSGNVTPDCSGGCWYNSGTLVTLAATAESGYTFSSWSGDSDCSDGQITMDNNKTCTANFTEQSKTGSIRVSIIPQEAVNAGAQWKLTTESTWRDSGTIKANVPFGTYQVEFKPVTGWNTPPNKEVAISIVNPDVWIDSDPYTQQAGTLSVTTTPVSGNIYVDGTYKGTGSWSSSVSTGSYTVSFGDVSGYNTPSSQTVTVYTGQTTSVTGTYTQQSSQYQLTTSVNPTGSGSVDPDCSGGCWYGSGTPVTLTATENSVYTFSGWSGCDSSSGTTCYVTMNDDKTVTATFTVLSQVFLQPGPEDGMDIWISSYYDYNDDYGVNDYKLKVGGWTDYYHTLIRFDLSGLPSNVNSAKIYLYTYGNNGGSNVSMYLDRITDIWTEDTGWNDRPSYANISTISSPILDTWYSIDITDLYKAWQNNTYENHGIQLRPTSNNNQFNEFYSSNYMDDPSLRPKLVIEVPVPQPNISLSPAKHDFGSVTAGSQSASQGFTILNTGSADLVIGSLSLTGTGASEFSIQNDNCSSQTLLPVGTCTVDVVFSPTSSDTKSANLAISSNDLETPVLDIPLSGTGVSALVPDITVSDSVAPDNDLRVPFGDITTGNSSDKTITVSNNGTGTLELNDIAQANPLADPFSILNDNCSWQTLAPTEKCTLTVRFSPNTEGIFNDTFDIPSNDPDENPVTVSVSGTGLPSVINTPPTAPELISPSNGATDLPTTVIFKWKPSTDTDGDTVTYDLYYCENHDFSGCSPVKVASLKNGRETPYAGIGYGAGILLFGIVIAEGIRKRKKIVLLIAMILIAGLLLVSCGGGKKPGKGGGNDTGGSDKEVSYTVTGLSPLTTYYWKVVAKDDNGGETKSDIYTFTTTDK